MSEKQGFKKELRPVDVWGLALGAIVGWGCFILPGNAFLPKSGPLGMAIGMLLGAGIVIVISLSYGYLIEKFPVSGGEFVYADSAFGKVHGFICGWALILAYWSLIPLNATAVGLISRYLFPGIIQVGALYTIAGWEVYAGEIIVASVFLVALAYLNIKGVKGSGMLQTAVSLILVASILLVTVIVLFKCHDFTNLMPVFQNEGGRTTFSCIFAVVAMTPWAFIGFDCIPQAAEEYSFSHKKSLFLMISAVLVAALLYICINTITAIVMPWQDLLAQNPFWATGTVIEMTMGKPGLFLVGIAMLCAVVSGMNAFYLSTSRLLYAMAQVNALPNIFAEIDPKYGTPKKSILFVMAVSLMAPWFGREVLNWIVDMTSVGASLAFTYTTAAAAVLAWKAGHKGQSFVGMLGVVAGAFFLGLLLIPGMPGFLAVQSRIALAVWTVLGIIFFFIMRKKYLGNKDNMDHILQMKGVTEGSCPVICQE